MFELKPFSKEFEEDFAYWKKQSDKNSYDMSNTSAAAILKERVKQIYDITLRHTTDFYHIGVIIKGIDSDASFRAALSAKHGRYFKNVYEFCNERLGISSTKCKALFGIVEHFGNGVVLLDRYKPFSISKLVEMLPLSQEERDRVTPDMTVKQIRALKKKIGPTSDQKEDAPAEEYYTAEQLQDLSEEDLAGYVEYTMKTDCAFYTKIIKFLARQKIPMDYDFTKGQKPAVKKAV